MSTNRIDEMSEVDAKDALNDICNALGIGGFSRSKSIMLTCIDNAVRRSNCLSRIEGHLSTIETDENGEECELSLLNWGEEPDAYLKTFESVLADREQLTTQ